jgi:hypothetical protein
MQNPGERVQVLSFLSRTQAKSMLRMYNRILLFSCINHTIPHNRILLNFVSAIFYLYYKKIEICK